jgi:hypothetical protein
MDEKRRINPQKPMRQNRWRKRTQQIPRRIGLSPAAAQAAIAESSAARDRVHGGQGDGGFGPPGSPNMTPRTRADTA